MADSLAQQRLPKNSLASRALRKNPPERNMTRAKEVRLLAIAIVFDALKFMFVWFWFFAPFIIGAVANTAAGGGIAGKIAGFLGIGVGAAISPAIGAIGIVLAMAVGALGWMVLITVMAMSGIPLLAGNSRRFLKMFVAFCASEAPFLDMIPAFTPFIFSVIREERAADKKALAAHRAEQAAAMRQSQRAAYMQQQQMMEVEVAKQEQQTEQAEQEAADAEAETQRQEQVRAQEQARTNVVPYERKVRDPLLGVPSL